MDKATYEAERKAILGDLVDPLKCKLKVPKHKCGAVMIKRFGKGAYYCPLCSLDGQYLKKASK